MSRKVNSFDVAKRAGVSQATVSYVLNGRFDLRIRRETREKVLEAARDLGYQPNLSARNLALGSTRNVALWVPFSYYSVFNHVIEQVMRLARASQFHVIIVQIAHETREDMMGVGRFSGANVDAIIALDAQQLVDDIVSAYSGAPPIISIGPAYSRHTDHVGVDLAAGSEVAVQHLVDIGCRRVAVLGHGDHMHSGDPRFAAYERVLAAAGQKLELIPVLFSDQSTSGNVNSESACRAVSQYFKDSGHPDGLFCWNDDTAIGANRALADLGLRVPQDVAIIGSDGIRETKFCVPSLSTMVLPFEEMCSLAWRYLEVRLQDPAAPIQSTVLQMRLEQRASTTFS